MIVPSWIFCVHFMFDLVECWSVRSERMPMAKEYEGEPLMKKTQHPSGYQAVEDERELDTPPPNWQQKLARRLQIRNKYVRILLAEFLGTFILCSLGIGSIAQSVLSRHDIPNGNIVTITLGWGLGIAMGIYACGNVSGGHINPAVTLAMAVLGRIKALTIPFYMLGQYMGAFCAAFSVYVVYYDALKNYALGERHVPYHINSTGDIWATYPLDHVTTEQGLSDQILSTFLFLVIILAITDERNMNVPKGHIPIMIGMAFVGLLNAFSYNCGGALNPARDLAPRIFTTIAGWKGQPFTFRNGNWFWVPIVGPHIGAVLGAIFYSILVGVHWPNGGRH